MSRSTPPRPKRNDPEIIKAAAKGLAVKVLEWLKAGGDEIEASEVEEDLVSVMAYNRDGYELAKALDRKGWAPDDELVEILRESEWLKLEAHDKAQIEWVKSVGLAAPPVGATVRFEHQGQTVTGEITRNDTHGKSTVCCPSLGHVKEGPGTLGLVIEWERLTV